jgi:hypothetical protein
MRVRNAFCGLPFRLASLRSMFERRRAAGARILNSLEIRGPSGIV